MTNNKQQHAIFFIDNSQACQQKTSQIKTKRNFLKYNNIYLFPTKSSPIHSTKKKVSCFHEKSNKFPKYVVIFLTNLKPKKK